MRDQTVLLKSANAILTQDEVNPEFYLLTITDKRGTQSVRPMRLAQARAFAERVGGLTSRGSEVLNLPAGTTVQSRVMGGTCHVARGRASA